MLLCRRVESLSGMVLDSGSCCLYVRVRKRNEVEAQDAVRDLPIGM